MTLTKKQILLVLVVTGLISRLLFLNQPNQVIFDEVHWGKFITAYAVTHENFFDVHPPHGKLLIAQLAKLAGYQGNQNYEPIGTPYTGINVWVLRILPALAGSLIPAVVFLLLLEMGTSLFAGLLGGYLFLFDNAVLVQSRFMGLYPMLLFCLLGSLLSFFIYIRSTQFQKTFAFLLCGFLAGWCIGLQFTGILVFAVLGLIQFRRWIQKRVTLKQAITESCLIFLIAATVYLIGWYLHFAVLYQPGSGDAFYKNTGNFWRDLVELHRIMYNASATLTTSHPEASAWYTWPFMLVPIYYWKGENASLYFLGNPVFWWLTTLLFVPIVLKTIWHLSEPKSRKKIPEYTIVLILAFAISFIPLTVMKRILFMYHYLTPLAFESLCVIVWADTKGYCSLKSPAQRRGWAICLVIILLGFLSILPVTVGYSPPSWYWNVIPWRLWH